MKKPGIIGEYDEETWTDSNTREPKSTPILTLLYIEYAGAGGNGTKQTPVPPAGQSGEAQQKMPDNFEGYQSFDAGANPYFPEQP